MSEIQYKYPFQYERCLTLKDGRKVFIRPILASDRDLLIDLFNKLSLESRYLRFLRYMDSLPDYLLDRLTQVNYDTEFALVAVIKENGKDAIIGVGRYAYDPNQAQTDLAVAVRDDWHNLGLGKYLLEKTISIGKEKGIYRFFSVLDPRNNLIRHLAAKLGYKVKYFIRGGSLQMEIDASTERIESLYL